MHTYYLCLIGFTPMVAFTRYQKQKIRERGRRIDWQEEAKHMILRRTEKSTTFCEGGAPALVAAPVITRANPAASDWAMALSMASGLRVG